MIASSENYENNGARAVGQYKSRITPAFEKREHSSKVNIFASGGRTPGGRKANEILSPRGQDGAVSSTAPQPGQEPERVPAPPSKGLP